MRVLAFRHVPFEGLGLIEPALESRGISVLAASPGWVRTDMGREEAPLPLEKGGQNIARLVTDVPFSQTDQFLSESGEIPW